MKFAGSFAVILWAGIALAGCADNSLTNLLDDRGSAPQVQAQTYQDLTMPPDLQLPPPGAAPPPTAPVASTAPAAAPATKLASAEANPYGTAPAAQPQGDVYDRNGISKFHADGTPKTSAELQAELKNIYLAKKRQKNPNYGTIFNIGEIFSDG